MSNFAVLQLHCLYIGASWLTEGNTEKQVYRVYTKFSAHAHDSNQWHQIPLLLGWCETVFCSKNLHSVTADIQSM